MTLRVPILIALAVASLGLRVKEPGVETKIRDMLASQVEAWNRGDIPRFVSFYAEDCVFAGKQVLQGRSNLLARYKKTYPSAEAMGKLSFENLTIHPLDEQVATAVGEWHINRPAASGGPVGGIFSLVLQLRNGTWQIVLDHTS
ncbi:MAG: nuclear transport factor 2 family protein [Acidobacteriaceae bacterium]|nr:nuclear transport factor 2 family protein [Acidobacteriaceae bacterium]MBV9778504.1 nuclear transport factor 2 family protein [Acidobacteriaceae bacterium]